LKQELAQHMLFTIQTGKPDYKKTALDLMRRAIDLDNAIRALILPYTYAISGIDRERQEARHKLGVMVADILVDMRDDLVEHAVSAWLATRALTKDPEDVILEIREDG